MPLLDALKKMDDANVSQVPVRAGSTVVGMLSREQIVRYVRQRAEVGS
jgi:predicted transcriptional regulator